MDKAVPELITNLLRNSPGNNVVLPAVTPRDPVIAAADCTPCPALLDT
jgi:hypothetical protein